MLSEFYRIPLLGILRGIKQSDINDVADLIIRSGLTTVEVAMNTDQAALLIEKIIEKSEGKLIVGAGTVTDEKRLKDAIRAGAEFIVMPVIEKNIIKKCRSKNIPVFPGALTVNEIFEAWSFGAEMVKVFPAKVFGPAYIKEVLSPLDNLKLMACGGVNSLNIIDYFKNGAKAIAFGSSIFEPGLIKNKEFQKIENNIRELIREYEKYNNKKNVC